MPDSSTQLPQASDPEVLHRRKAVVPLVCWPSGTKVHTGLEENTTGSISVHYTALVARCSCIFCLPTQPEISAR